MIVLIPREEQFKSCEKPPAESCQYYHEAGRVARQPSTVQAGIWEGH